MGKRLDALPWLIRFLAILVVPGEGTLARAADLQLVRVGKPLEHSQVPGALARGHFLPPQAVSSVNVSGDGQKIAVTSMAFRHDRNFWLLSEQGHVVGGRYVHPWAPFQVAATGKGGAFATALAYSRITPPYPTLALFAGTDGPETVRTDRGGERGWLRYGHGDWRTGWLVSALGDQLVRVGDSVITIPTGDGAWQLTDNGQALKLPTSFPSQRPYRLSASGNGRVVALSYIVPDVSRLEKGSLPEAVRVQVPPALVSVRRVSDGQEIGRVAAPREPANIAPLPDPVQDYPELAAQFALRPDAILPFWVAASVAVDAEGSRIAVTEYAGWLWVRGRPAIGSWDPPYHVIPFVPRQRGWLRIIGTTDDTIVRKQLPQEGLFEVRLDERGHQVWCYPMGWFARGMAGCAWRPADADARTVYGCGAARGDWTHAWQFPDAVSDLAVQPGGQHWLVSCWDGKLYLLDRAGQLEASLLADSPARLQWSRDGRLAVAGTQAGEVLGLDADGKLRWRLALPVAELPPLAQPIERVFAEVPIYQVSRVGPEHAYVGDTWLIKTERGGVLVDTGGTSGLPFTLQRLKSAGLDVKDVRYLLHTHSHGDHCGAGYLWRALGLKTVAPASADFTLAWLMPMLSDYGVWPPRPVDQPLPLKRAGDEAVVTLGDLKIRAIFVPGHSFDSVIYAMELAGKRVVFTGDIGFDNQDILHRCWGDVEKARAVTEVVRGKVIPFRPDFVFRGHGAKRDGTAFLEELVRRSQEAIRQVENKQR